MSHPEHMTVVSLAGFLRSLREPKMAPLWRCVLGCIASGRGGPVPTRKLINMIWGERWRDGAVWEKRVWNGGPDDAGIALRVIVFRLRHVHGFDIRNESGRGYSLNPDQPYVVSRDAEAAE